MKISKNDFIKIGNNDQILDEKHKWEILMPIGGGNYRSCTFSRNEYETGEALHEAVLDLIRGCRFFDTEYHVFMDCGSYPTERVYAWLPRRDYPGIDLPEGVMWENEC